MATIKSYTDIEQSRKLAEILPIESADMYYCMWNRPLAYFGSYKRANFINGDNNAIPCWSLAALLGVLPPIEEFYPIIDLDINLIRYEGNYRDELCFNGNNLIDACYEMILKLHKLKML